MACERCNGYLHTERVPYTNIHETHCLLCGHYLYNPEPPDPPARLDYGLCLCGKEAMRGAGDCSACRGKAIVAGREKHREVKA